MTGSAVTRNGGPRRVIHLGIPPRYEALKEERGAAVPLGGAQVAESALVEALLKYRPLDELCFVPTTTQTVRQLADLLSGYPGGAETPVIAPEELAQLPGRSLVFQNSLHVYEAAGLRAMFGSPDWPTVGLTHALSGIDAILAALFGVLPSGLVAPFDRLICTSEVGQRAFTALQRQARASAGLVPDIDGYRPEGEPASGSAEPGIRTHVIPLGVDAEHFVPGLRSAARDGLGIEQRDIVFLYCGRLSVEYKMDPFPLLAAFASAFRDQPRASLIVAGDTSGGGHARIPEVAAHLGIGERVRVLPDPTARVKLRLYQAADVFVSFSDNLQETFGLTLVEAMSCGLPVLASDWSGYRETVVHGETGFLVPTYWRAPDGYSSRFATFAPDHVTHLMFSGEVTVDVPAAVAAMRSLAAHAGLRETLGRRGRDRALRHYAWPVVMAAYGRLFTALLDEAAAIAPGRSEAAAGYPPFGYDRQAVFGHFATAVGVLPARVERALEHNVFTAAVTQVAPEAMEVLELTCPVGATVALGTVLDRLTAVLGERRAAIRTVQLLLKYGAIFPVPNSSG
jgi:D-inositol-3-phosphate glycosyltransferase